MARSDGQNQARQYALTLLMKLVEEDDVDGSARALRAIVVADVLDAHPDSMTKAECESMVSELWTTMVDWLTGEDA